MHLVLVSHNYFPEPTGIPAYNTALATWFRRRGWRVTVLTGVPHYPWWKVPEPYASRDHRYGRGDEIIDGVEVLRVDHHVPSPPPGGLARMRLDASWLWAWFRRSRRLNLRPDVIVVVAPPFLVGALGCWLRRRWQRPVVYHVQDLQVDAALELGMLPQPLAVPLRWLERRVLGAVDVVTTVSRGMQRRLDGKCAARRPTMLMPNWADVDHLRPEDAATRSCNPYRREWDASERTTVIAYAGNLGRKQGLDGMLAAWRLLHRFTDLRLVLAGDGSERVSLAARTTDLPHPRFRLIGLQPVEHLGSFLGAADIHCIPQRAAAADLVMPSKLLNILAVGRPVVVAAEPGTELAEVVLRAGCGLVVRPEDPTAFAEALAILIADPQRREAMGRAGRAYCQTHFGADAVLGRFERLLRALPPQRASAAGFPLPLSTPTR